MALFSGYYKLEQKCWFETVTFNSINRQIEKTLYNPRLKAPKIGLHF